jgi:hypothetical protein
VLPTTRESSHASSSFSSQAKMLEIKQGINAAQVNSASTPKCLKTQSFYS